MTDTTTAKAEKKGLVKLNFKPVEVIFEDQFGKRIKGVFCSGCNAIGKYRDFLAYHNYGGEKKEIDICDSCLEECQNNGLSISRNEKKHAQQLWLAPRGFRGNPSEIM